MSKEAMKLALEALLLSDTVFYPQTKIAIAVIEEALANHCEDNLDMVKQERPQNCGTSYCSCIECVMDEQEQGEPVACDNCKKLEDELEHLRIKAELWKRDAIVWKSAYDVEVGFCEQEQGEPWGHGGRPMTLRECMEAEEPEQGHSFTYAQMKEQVEGLQRDYDLLLAEYNLLKQEHGEPVAYLLQRQDRSGYETGEKTDYGAFPVYTTPQQRTWVGLDLDERSTCYEKSGGNLAKFAKELEAKIKEKNT